MKIFRYILAIPLGILFGAVMQFIATYLHNCILSFFIPDFISDFTHIKSWFPLLVGGASTVATSGFIAPKKKLLFGFINLALSVIAITYISITPEWNYSYIAFIIGGCWGIFNLLSEEHL